MLKQYLDGMKCRMKGCKNDDFTHVSRKHRKMMELHGDMVEHGQPVMTVFHRPEMETTTGRRGFRFTLSIIPIC